MVAHAKSEKVRLDEIAVSDRLAGFSYAIRNIVVEARKVEETGRRVRYLNIGDPVQFGFSTPAHLVEAVERAIRDGHNGYGPSPGILSAREAVAADYTRKGLAISPDRVLLTSGASEGIELALTALVNPGEEVLVPVPTYPLYTAVLAKIGARAVYYRLDPNRSWLPDLGHLKSLSTKRARAIVVIDPNNPTGAVYSDEVRRAMLGFSEERGLVLLADEVYAELAFDGPVPPLASLAPKAAVISFGSLSKGYLAPGWRAGWLAVSQTDRLAAVLAAIKKLADGRLCSPVPMQHAIAAALNGTRLHQAKFIAALRERAELTVRRLNAIKGITCAAPSAAFYAMPQVALPPGRTDEDFVLGLLRSKGLLCVHGSGFGMDKGGGFFRIVFLPPINELSAAYDDIAAFTPEFLGSGSGARPS
jgi:alanine-synthesizing transaminase